MTEQRKEHGTPEGFDTRSSFVHDVSAAFHFAILQFSNGYPRNGFKFDPTLEFYALTLINSGINGALSESFRLPDGKMGNSNQHATYQLAEFLATAKAKGYGEDDRHLKPVYDFMKSVGIPIIEYRNEVGPNAEFLNEPLNADELAEWARVQAEAKGAPATSGD